MILRFFLNRLFNLKKNFCEIQLKKNLDLYKEIISFKKNDISKYVSWITIFQIYNYILEKKPKKILELGSGLSTVIILNAIKKIKQKNSNYKPDFISMENHKKYFLNTKKKLPKHYRGWYKLVLSKTVKDSFLLFSGYRYLNIPKMKYDFIFVDGPNYNDQEGMSSSFDIVYILNNFSQKFDCIIEKRVSTSYIMQKLLGRKSVKLSLINRTTFLKADKKKINKRLDSRVFFKGLFSDIYFKGYY